MSWAEALFEATDGLLANVYLANTMKWKDAKETQIENIVAVSVSFPLCTATVEGPEATDLTTDMLSQQNTTANYELANPSSVYSDSHPLCVTMGGSISKL